MLLWGRICIEKAFGQKPEAVKVASITFLLILLLMLLAGCEKEGVSDKPNFILIILDATRPDHLGCYGYERPTSPTIDDLAAKGVRYEDAITQAPWTKASFAGMLTSLACFQHGITDWTSVLPDTFVLLPEVLAEGGYATACVINMVGMDGRFGMLRGFQHQSVAGKYDRNATATTDKVLELVRTLPRPFFILAHYFDTHHPYNPPKEFVELITGDMTRVESCTKSEGGSERKSQDLKKLQSGKIAHDIVLYDACIRYVDTEIGRIIETLKQMGIYETTLLIVTADHGEAFGEHGTTGHGRTLYDEELKVPLILHLPLRFTKPTAVTGQVRLIDLAPSLLELARIPIPSSWEGVSILPPRKKMHKPSGKRLIPPHIAITETSMRPGVLPLKSARTSAWKVILEPATGLMEVYNLKNDPLETTNLLSVMPAPADSLAELLERIPGSSFAGWRIAFVGTSSACTFRAHVEAEGGGKLVHLKKHAYRGHLVARKENDGTLTVESQPAGINLLSLDCIPQDAELAFRFDVEGKGARNIFVGRNGRRAIGTTFKLNPMEATGLPEEFTNYRKSKQSGVFIWWLPGRRELRQRTSYHLSPQEKKRLKALGYVQ